MKNDKVSTNGLARSSLHRRDKSWLVDKIHDEKSRIIPVHNSTVLCANNQESGAVFLTHKNFAESSDRDNSFIFLGVYD